MTGIFILTLPIPIVVTSFAACYKNRLWRNEITMKKRMVSNYNHKDHRLSEKRNLFPDLAGAGGFYIQKPDNLDIQDDSSLASMVMTPSTIATNVNVDPFSPSSARDLLNMSNEESYYQKSKKSTETSFLVEGTVEEKLCLVQQTDV